VNHGEGRRRGALDAEEGCRGRGDRCRDPGGRDGGEEAHRLRWRLSRERGRQGGARGESFGTQDRRQEDRRARILAAEDLRTEDDGRRQEDRRARILAAEDLRTEEDGLAEGDGLTEDDGLAEESDRVEEEGRIFDQVARQGQDADEECVEDQGEVEERAAEEVVVTLVDCEPQAQLALSAQPPLIAEITSTRERASIGDESVARSRSTYT
jgi:hypothetical protein